MIRDFQHITIAIHVTVILPCMYLYVAVCPVAVTVSILLVPLSGLFVFAKYVHH